MFLLQGSRIHFAHFTLPESASTIANGHSRILCGCPCQHHFRERTHGVVVFTCERLYQSLVLCIVRNSPCRPNVYSSPVWLQRPQERRSLRCVCTCSQCGSGDPLEPEQINLDHQMMSLHVSRHHNTRSTILRNHECQNVSVLG